MPPTSDTGASASPVLAGWGRRFLALLVDWLACVLVTIVAVGGVAAWQTTPWSSWLTMGIFWAETALGTMLTGGSFGQLATRLRVLRTTGGTLDPLRAMLRSLLVCLLVPPLVFKPDGRGLHDLAVGSATYQL